MLCQLVASVGWRLRVDDLVDNFVGKKTCSMPKLTKSTLQKHRGQSSKVESITMCGSRNTVMTTSIEDATQTIIAEELQGRVNIHAE